ncbi:putative adhesin [Flavobacterium sp.]|uniref:putative adhesin n=1 Tax=Flavobacterium sp. TaxID=239 RepID=UPI003D0DD4BA
MSVQVTNKDLVLLGHGSYPGGATNTRLPLNIDLYLLPPVGYTLTTGVASALIQQVEIKKIKLSNNGTSVEIIEPPFVIYSGGTDAPNLTLYNLGDLSQWGTQTIGQKENVVTVSKDTLLSVLIESNEKIKEALKNLPKGEKLKLYWSACANQVSGYTASLV